tara:strand:- start:2454 stop:2822 length:369 start_codon:yes stop_codon:yes gene_type:complete
MTNIGINVIDCKINEQQHSMEEIITMVNNDYESLEVNNNMDNYIASEIDYNLNYTVEQLKYIMKYYGFSVRKKNKEEMVQEIVIYELDDVNNIIVNHRKYLWNCLDAIKNDDYLSKYLNINT